MYFSNVPVGSCFHISLKESVVVSKALAYSFKEIEPLSTASFISLKTSEDKPLTKLKKASIGALFHASVNSFALLPATLAKSLNDSAPVATFVFIDKNVFVIALAPLSVSIPKFFISLAKPTRSLIVTLLIALKPPIREATSTISLAVAANWSPTYVTALPKFSAYSAPIPNWFKSLATCLAPSSPAIEPSLAASNLTMASVKSAKAFCAIPRVAPRVAYSAIESKVLPLATAICFKLSTVSSLKSVTTFLILAILDS